MSDMTIREKAIAAFLCATDGYAALYESAANKGFDVYDAALANCAAGEWISVDIIPTRTDGENVSRPHLVTDGHKVGESAFFFEKGRWQLPDYSWDEGDVTHYAEIHPRKGE